MAATMTPTDTASRITWDTNPRGDKNGYKLAMMNIVLYKQYHLIGKKGENFEKVATMMHEGVLKHLPSVSVSGIVKEYNKVLIQVQQSLMDESNNKGIFMYFVSVLFLKSFVVGDVDEDSDSALETDDDDPMVIPNVVNNVLQEFEKVTQIILYETNTARSTKKVREQENKVIKNRLCAVENDIIDGATGSSNRGGKGDTERKSLPTVQLSCMSF